MKQRLVLVDWQVKHPITKQSMQVFISERVLLLLHIMHDVKSKQLSQFD